MDYNHYKDSLILLEACVEAIGLHILQGFYVKQGNIYGSNYYP
jgi:hypothetical protein